MAVVRKSDLRKLDTLAAKFTRAGREFTQEAQHILVEEGNIIRNNILNEFSRGSKSGIIYKFKSVRHQSSAPGEAPAVRSGELERSVQFDLPTALMLEVGTEGGGAYGEYLEEGTRKMKPRPWLNIEVKPRGPIIARKILDAVDDILSRNI